MLERRDPCGFITVPPSTVVRVTGTARQDINGLLGIVESFNVEKERYLVHMTRSQSTMAIRKENLAKASFVESYQAQWEQLQNDARVQEKMSNYLNFLRQYVAPLALSHVVGGVLTLLVFLVYFMGLAKTILLISSISLIALIAGPDLTSGPKGVVENFLERASAMIEKQFPIIRGKISNRIAVCIILCLFTVCIQSLFSIVVGAELRHTEKTLEMPTIDRAVLEQYYSFGYEDAVKGRVHRFSLAGEFAGQTKTMRLAEEVRKEVFDEVEGSPLLFLRRFTSLTNLGSIFYLYRSVIDLGTDQSTNLFSMGQLAANIQHNTEWWKKAVLVLSLYNVLRIFR